eukprot:TRINITY_DN1245_c1_g1_i1.p1 TRINITY_DN1245_c1_g1~~TRINITY_DN1245_c1_g1_i1.p1  ORF type:complete len:342 (+),score=59.67 TRINITY_DN1245_c1_g1_i1:111-1028(+)
MTADMHGRNGTGGTARLSLLQQHILDTARFGHILGMVGFVETRFELIGDSFLEEFAMDSAWKKTGSRRRSSSFNHRAVWHDSLTLDLALQRIEGNGNREIPNDILVTRNVVWEPSRHFDKAQARCQSFVSRFGDDSGNVDDRVSEASSGCADESELCEAATEVILACSSAGVHRQLAGKANSHAHFMTVARELNDEDSPAETQMAASKSRPDCPFTTLLRPGAQDARKLIESSSSIFSLIPDAQAGSPLQHLSTSETRWLTTVRKDARLPKQTDDSARERTPAAFALMRAARREADRSFVAFERP